jgi:hypothetical protein
MGLKSPAGSKIQRLVRAPALVQKLVPTASKKESELEKTGLSPEKIQAIGKLRDFHTSFPAYTEENILKRNLLLEELIHEPQKTVIGFSKIMRESSDDSLKSFLLNLTMNTRLEDHHKAQIFLARLKAGATFSLEGVVPDQQLSFMIGISHLSRIENEDVKYLAKLELKEEISLIDQSGFKIIYKDYFNEPI